MVISRLVLDANKNRFLIANFLGLCYNIFIFLNIKEVEKWERFLQAEFMLSAGTIISF